MWDSGRVTVVGDDGASYGVLKDSLKNVKVVVAPIVGSCGIDHGVVAAHTGQSPVSREIL